MRIGARTTSAQSASITAQCATLKLNPLTPATIYEMIL